MQGGGEADWDLTLLRMPTPVEGTPVDGQGGGDAVEAFVEMLQLPPAGDGAKQTKPPPKPLPFSSLSGCEGQRVLGRKCGNTTCAS